MRPLDVHIHTNTGCNLQCRHCYVNAQPQMNTVIADDFEVELISFLCRSFDADIHLEGGEIFLEEHLIQALNRLDGRHKRCVTITSNGTVKTTSPDTLKSLRSISLLRISVEGHTDELHRKVRDCSLRTVLSNAAYYKSQGINTAIRITMNAFNMDSIFSNVIPGLLSEGFDDFQIYEVQPVGRGLTSELCIEGTLDSFFEDWLAHPSRANTTVSLPKRRVLEVKRRASALRSIGVMDKYVGNAASVSINAFGEVTVCPWNMLSEPSLRLDVSNINELLKAIEMQAVPHECEFCSRVVLKGGAQC